MDDRKHPQIAMRNVEAGRPALAEAAPPHDDLADWLEAYFRFEVTSLASSQAVQRRDLTLFLDFMAHEEGASARADWYPGSPGCSRPTCAAWWTRPAAGAGATAPSTASSLTSRPSPSG